MCEPLFNEAILAKAELNSSKSLFLATNYANVSHQNYLRVDTDKASESCFCKNIGGFLDFMLTGTKTELTIHATEET